MPYRGQRRRYNPYAGSGGRLSDLMLAQGEQQANLAREQGDIWGQFIQNVGQTAGDTLRAYQQDERERPAREQAQRIADRQEDELTRSLAERDRAEAQAGRLESYGDQFDWGYTGNTYGVRNLDEVMQNMPPQDRVAFANQYKTLFDSIGVARKAAEETMGVWAESIDVDEMMANPRLLGMALAPMVQNNMIPEDIAAKMYMEAMDNPRSIPQHIQGFLRAAGKLTPQEMETHVLEPGETLVGVTGGNVQELYTPTVLPEVPELDYQFVTREDGSVWAINKNDPSQRVLAIEATGQLPPQEEPSFTNRLDLRKAFASETSAMAEIDDAVKIMNTATQMMDPTWVGPDGIKGNADDGGEHNIPAATQMILVKFQKVLDPGSVVRESEYARSASGQSILGSIRAFISASERGGILTADQLQSFANAARGYAQSRQQDIDKVVKFYAESAQRDLGIAADDALGGVRLFDMWRTRNPAPLTGNERIRLGGRR